MFEEAVVDSPNVIMKVTERGGADVDSAQVGDALELHFEIFDQQSPYEIFVRDLVAKDGNDNNEIVLIGIYVFQFKKPFLASHINT